MKWILFLTLLSSVAMAKDCSYQLKKDDLKLTWTAYKTPLKAGVNGSFDELGVKDDIKAKNFNTLISNISFEIKTQTVNTGNPDRDKKIATFFFAPLGESISGKTIKYEKKILMVELTMNKVTKTIPLKVTSTDASFEANGVIDILDFQANEALAGINMACLELHEGKTWSDVALKLEAKFSKSCK